MGGLDLVNDYPRRETSNVSANRDARNVPANRDRFTDNDDAGADSYPDPHKRHRLDFALYAIRDGHQPIRDTISRLYEGWNASNLGYFFGQLLPPHLLLAEPQCPRALGDYSSLSGWGSTNQIRIRPSTLDGSHPFMRPGDRFAEGRLLFAQDIVLHETVHQYATEILGQPEASYRGHGPVFRDECNRIGGMLDLPMVRTAKARGSDRLLKSCAEWPICVRPRGYYLGAYRFHEMEEIILDEATDESSLPPEPPKHLADWQGDNPMWAEQYRILGESIFELLDRFFEANPAPKPVRDQAVRFLARCYRHHVPTRSTSKSTLPATVGGR